MSLTPPHDMEMLFPDLLELTEAAQSQPKPDRKSSPIINVEVMNQDLDLELFLTNQRRGFPNKRMRRQSSEPELSPMSPHSSTNDDADYMSGYKCMTKSAVAARENRMKKKHHIETLERNVNKLTTENRDLHGSVASLSKSVKSLQNEVQYLKGILANESTLSTLLQNIPGSPGVRLTSSELATPDCAITSSEQGRRSSSKRKAVAQLDHGYATHRNVKQLKKNSENENPAGVCLHVSGSSVSLEFCAACSNKASSCRDEAD